MPSMPFESVFYFRTSESAVVFSIACKEKMTQVLMDGKVSFADYCWPITKTSQYRIYL